jgi:ABC-2 type transport system permease protein
VIFQIAIKDLKIVFRDKKALAIMLVMPAVIMFILGNALGPMFEDSNPIERFTVVVVNEDEGILSQVLINDVFRKHGSDVLNTFLESDEDKANEMLKNKKVSSVVIIPEGFTRRFFEGYDTNIAVKTQADQQYKASIVKSITDGFCRQVFLYWAAASSGVEVLSEVPKEEGILGEKSEEFPPDLNSLMFDMQQKTGEGILEFYEDIESNGEGQEKHETVSGMQYYSAAMLVMFILFGASTGTKLMVEERQSNTLGRLLTTGVGKVSLVAGKFLGLLLITFTQAMILIVFTRFSYGVDWGRSIDGVVIITVCAAFSGSGLGMMIGSMAKTSSGAEGLSQLFIQTFTIIGGGMMPLYMMPGFLRVIAKGTLNWWAVNGYYDLMLGSGFTDILPCCGVLVLMGVLYLGIGVARFKTQVS